MDIDRFRTGDIDDFLFLAEREGWICDRWEFDFILGTFPEGCFTAKVREGNAGFVTSIKYGTSGWIGNLIVMKELRGFGIGRLLMGKALAALAAAGAETVWLTASEEGRHLYETLGFSKIDSVTRWIGKGTGRDVKKAGMHSRNEILAIDQGGWGDRRESLIDAALSRGRLSSLPQSFIVSQRGRTGVQIGPWCGDAADGGILIDDALAWGGKGEKVFLDVPERNRFQAGNLSKRGFSVKGRALLMFRGLPPAYAPEKVFALGSMGSIG